MSLDCEVVLTRSGARAMLDRTSGEVMHPVVGPLVEADRLYVVPSALERRLAQPLREPLVLLDVGLGAGSNAAAALRLRDSMPAGARRLQLVSIDRSLAAFELALRSENAPAFGWTGGALEAALAVQRTRQHDTERSSWRLVEADALDALAREPAASADVVFWDPFSPSANPELWSLRAFVALRRVCHDGVSVHTYSGATAVRAALLLAGFWVGMGEKISEGKLATLAGLGPEGLARPLDRRWLERLARSSAPFPADAPPDALERVRALPQFT